MGEFNARNIAYVDIFNWLCTISCFIPTSRHDRNITFYRLLYEIPLAQALSMIEADNHFVLSKENEDDRRN